MRIMINCLTAAAFAAGIAKAAEIKTEESNAVVLGQIFTLATPGLEYPLKFLGFS